MSIKRKNSDGTWTRVAGAQSTDDCLKLSGGAMTGAMTVLTPSADMNPATKKYVDDKTSKDTVEITGYGISVTIDNAENFVCNGIVYINCCIRVESAVSAPTAFLHFSKKPITDSMSITLNRLTNSPQANRLVLSAVTGNAWFYDMNLVANDYIQITGTYRTND